MSWRARPRNSSVPFVCVRVLMNFSARAVIEKCILSRS